MTYGLIQFRSWTRNYRRRYGANPDGDGAWSTQRMRWRYVIIALPPVIIVNSP